MLYAHYISIKLEEKKTNLIHDFLTIKKEKRNNTEKSYTLHPVFLIPPRVTTCKTCNNTIRKLRLIQPIYIIQISQVFLVLMCVCVCGILTHV